MSLRPITFHNAIRILDQEFHRYIITDQNTYVGSLQIRTIRGSTYLILDWNTYKSMYLILHDDKFQFSVFNPKTARWQEDIYINYDIERGEFDQLQFAYEMYTLEYKNIKYLQKIKEQFYDSKR